MLFLSCSKKVGEKSSQKWAGLVGESFVHAGGVFSTLLGPPSGHIGNFFCYFPIYLYITGVPGPGASRNTDDLRGTMLLWAVLGGIVAGPGPPGGPRRGILKVDDKTSKG